jgi:PAS domain S-box-containing protein
MNPFAIASFVAFILCFFLGNFIYHKNPENQLNIMIAILSITVGFLAFIEFEYRQTLDFQTAYFWLKLSVLWPIVPSILLHISLIFNEKTKVLKNKYTYVLIYAPALIMAYVAFDTNWLFNGMVREYWGWTYIFPKDNLLFEIISLWTIICVIIAAGISIITNIKIEGSKKLQAKFLIAGLYFPLTISLVSDLILPNMSIRLPETTMIMSTLGITFISYGVWKYRFPALTTAAVADEIVSTMSNFLILLDNEHRIITVNQATTDLLGYDQAELVGNPVEMVFADKNQKLMFRRNNSSNTKTNAISHVETYLKSKNGKIIPVLLSESVIQNNDHQTVGIVCIGNDIEEIKEAQYKVKASLEEKEVLLREIHHRVKNNLQIISSLLNIQSNYIKDDKDLELLRESQTRIKSMAIIHEGLYKSNDFTHINFNEYINSLIHYISVHYNVSPKIQINVEVKNVMLNIETAVPCGLIINELVTNSIKHAFPNGSEGKIKVSLNSKMGICSLRVSDNGIGFPANIDFRNTRTLGLRLVNILSNQLDGKIELDKSHGTEFIINFKKIEYQKRL